MKNIRTVLGGLCTENTVTYLGLPNQLSPCPCYLWYFLYQYLIKQVENWVKIR